MRDYTREVTGLPARLCLTSCRSQVIKQIKLPLRAIKIRLLESGRVIFFKKNNIINKLFFAVQATTTLIPQKYANQCKQVYLYCANQLQILKY